MPLFGLTVAVFIADPLTAQVLTNTAGRDTLIRPTGIQITRPVNIGVPGFATVAVRGLSGALAIRHTVAVGIHSRPVGQALARGGTGLVIVVFTSGAIGITPRATQLPTATCCGFYITTIGYAAPGPTTEYIVSAGELACVIIAAFNELGVRRANAFIAYAILAITRITFNALPASGVVIVYITIKCGITGNGGAV